MRVGALHLVLGILASLALTTFGTAPALAHLIPEGVPGVVVLRHTCVESNTSQGSRAALLVARGPRMAHVLNNPPVVSPAGVLNRIFSNRVGLTNRPNAPPVQARLVLMSGL
jgi:hypothetical protein